MASVQSSLPQVSVLLAAYNAERSLAEALESIRAQDYPHWELVAVDDGSTDGTRAILEQFASTEPRTRVIIQGRNVGLASCLNLALSLARAPLIARMDADDRAVPNRFSLQVNFLATHPDVDILGGGAHVVDDGGRLEGELRPRTSHDALCAAIFRENPIIHPTVMMRREALQALGGYDTTLRRGQDYDLWLRAYPRYTLHNLAEPLIWYRRRGRPSWRDARYSARILLGALWRERRLASLPWLACRPILATAVGLLRVDRGQRS